MIPKRFATPRSHRPASRPRSVTPAIALQFVLCLAVYLAVHLGTHFVSGNTSPATAAEDPAPTLEQVMPIPLWLQLGPAPAPLPAFHAADENGFAVEHLLQPGTLDPRWVRPIAGEAGQLNSDPDQSWYPVQAPEGLLILAMAEDQEPGVPAESYLAVYLEVDRWTKTTLELRSAHPVKAYLDGQAVALEMQDGSDATPTPSESRPSDADSMQAQRHSGEIKLNIGKHCLLVHTVRDPAQEQEWSLAGNLSLAAGNSARGKPVALPTVTLDPTRAVTIDDILDAPRIGSLDLSADGKLVVVTLSEYGPDGEQDHWLEIRNTHDGGLERTWRGDMGSRQASWSPLGSRLAYTTHADEKSTIWIYDLDSGATNALVRDVENLGSYQWAPDGSFLIYSFTIQKEPDERKVKRVRHPADRQPHWRDRSYLMQVGLPGGATRRLTAGPLSTTGWSIASDGQHLLFFRSEPDLTERPFETSELWQLDLTTLEAEMLLADRWIGSAVYGPDPTTIALQGSPSAFTGLGLALAEGVEANDYGGQLYLFNLHTRQARAVSRDFVPAIADIRWSLADGLIYALCTDTQYRNLYTFDPERERWEEVPTGLDVTQDFTLARDAKIAVAFGTSVSSPNRLTVVDLRKRTFSLLHDPTATAYRDVTFGEVRPWTCQLHGGEILDGRVYYPRGFDPEQKYPVIVYYYGGTYPVTRDFGGRYPKNIWAGQGYFVYVPQPSGAIGYGQEFAARHVNDWGRRTAAEVIAGTEAFLAAHPAADPDRVGCIGASYGGFLTMYLLTQTDMFRAAVSHAGISSISSYWGEGFWGYAYGARALAHRYPWSDIELYVGQSPLFAADRITTPLLLLHGASDTNVPLGESTSLFTALKLLGREVEFVHIEDQDHWILDHDQRILWNDTILAFFAKWLKDRSAWWEELYPETRLTAETPASEKDSTDGK